MPASLNDLFADALRQLGVPDGARLALAVSGGADSMALCLLAQAYLASHSGNSTEFPMSLTAPPTEGPACWPHRLTALTIDHGLRPESAGEARQVAAWMAARGVAHQVLKVTPEAATQEAARTARYAALTQWCRQHGLRYLLLGHHVLDQAETVAIRHAAGSGPEGLAGMSAKIERGGVTLLRPLLQVPPEALREYLRGAGQGWVEDPSNANAKYDRARLRAGGFDRAHWLAVQRDAAAQRTLWERRIAEWMGAYAEIHPAGVVALDPAALATTEPELRWRLLRDAIMHVAGLETPPRTAKLKVLAERLAAEPETRRVLAGCVLVSWRGQLWICREPARSLAPVAWDGQSEAWWGRWRFPPLPPKEEGDYEIGTLGAEGLALLKRAGTWRDGIMPREAWLGLPVVRQREGNSLIESLPGLSHIGWDAAAAGVAWQPPKPLAGEAFFLLKDASQALENQTERR